MSSKEKINLRGVKNFLLKSGFSEEEADTQIIQLYEIITLSIAKRISHEILGEWKINIKKVSKYISTHQKDEKVLEILEQEPQNALLQYLENLQTN